MNAATRPRRVPGIQQKPRDGELMLYCREREPGWILNHSAWTIWNLCDGRHTVEDIARTVERAFGDARAGVAGIDEQVRDSVERLVDLGLLWTGEDPARPVDWERVARACEDGYDLAVVDEIAPGRAAGARPANGATADLDRAIALASEPGGLALPEGAEIAPAGGVELARELAAAEALVRSWPEGWRSVAALVRSLLLVRSAACPPRKRERCDPAESGSDETGAAWAHVGSPVALAESLVREAARQKLRRVGVGERRADRLVGNPAPTLYRWSAIDERALPMAGIVQALYARTYVARLHAALLELDRVPPEVEADRAWARLLDRTVDNLARVEGALDPILAEVSSDASGRRFFSGLRAWFLEIERATKEAQQRRLDGLRPRASIAEPMRVFVATDARQGLAERVFEYSLRKHATGPVQITWMDEARGEPFAGWKAGRKAVTSCFRFAVPELAGFRGRALYLDVDMLVLGDARELLDEPLYRPWLTTSACPAAAVIDCAWFHDKHWWPRIREMASNGAALSKYVGLLEARGALGHVSNRWNCHDGAGYVPGRTAIVHFTRGDTQPWRPDTDRTYARHESLELETAWWRAYIESQGLRFRGHSRVRPSARYVQLLDAYREMHRTVGDPFLGIPAEAMYRGDALLAHARPIRELVRRHGAKRLLDYGSGKGLQYSEPLERLRQLGGLDLDALRAECPAAATLPEYWGVEEVACYDPGAGLDAELEPRSFDGVVCTDVLEHVSELDLPWIVREIFELARSFVFCSVSTRSARRRLPTGENAHETRRPPGFWVALLGAVRADHPDVACELVCDSTTIHM